MKTESSDYQKYLSGKNLPGRRLYLENFLYPKYLKFLGIADGFIEDSSLNFNESSLEGSLENFVKNASKNVPTKTIADLGFGNGEFLDFCKKNNLKAWGLDSNPGFVELALSKGHSVALDNICDLSSVMDGSIDFGIIDNVLEHLSLQDLETFFKVLQKKITIGGTFLIIVPGEKGYTTDPTHKTFLDEADIVRMVQNTGLRVLKASRAPFNSRWVSRFFYLNMTLVLLTR